MILGLLLPGDLIVPARKRSQDSEGCAYVWPTSTQDLESDHNPPAAMSEGDLGIVLSVRQVHVHGVESTIEACVMTSRGDVGYVMTYDIRKVDP